MNARLTKEIRNLLPSLVGALLFIVLPYMVWRQQVGEFGLVALFCGCAIMAGSSFGNEFQHRTLALLLSQPIPRARIWWEKMLVLAGGLMIALAALLGCLVFYVRMEGARDAYWAILAIPVCAFCGVPFYTLSSRSGIVGVISACGVPTGISLVLALVGSWFHISDEVAGGALIVLAALYCVVVFWRGYVCFRNFEDIAAAPSRLATPAFVESRIERAFEAAGSRFRGPLGMLVLKELRLHQMAFLWAAVFSAVALIGAVLVKLGSNWGEGVLGGNYALYVLVLPFMIGALALSEERAWGVAEWHLTLPPSVSRQWAIKLGVMLATSFVLGAVLPLTWFWASQWFWGMGAKPFPEDFIQALPAVVMGQLLLTLIAAYTGSFTTSTLHGILFGLALALVLASWTGWSLGWAIHALMRATSIRDADPSLAWRMIAAMMLIPAGFLIRFTGRHFRYRSLSSWRFVPQILVLLLLCTSGVLVALALLARAP